MIPTACACWVESEVYIYDYLCVGMCVWPLDGILFNETLKIS